MFFIAGWIVSFLLQALTPPSTEEVWQMSFAMPRKAPKLVAEAIADAVRDDPQSPLLGSYKNEAQLMLEYAWRESTFRTNAVGDHGSSLGLFQLQRLSKEVAFNPKQSAVIWLQRAHDAYEKCSDNDESDRLAALCSGNCSHGKVEARGRYRRTMSLLAAEADLLPQE